LEMLAGRWEELRLRLPALLEDGDDIVIVRDFAVLCRDILLADAG
jgi:hypothetical protein